MAIVSIQDLTVYRGKTKILQNINWEIKPHENWALLGANGSGKTTLLSCITGYVTPSAGRIRVLDQEYGKTDWRELRKQVGLVSSSVRQMISDDQLGLDIVASGQQAVINSWRPPTGAERKRAFLAYWPKLSVRSSQTVPGSTFRRGSDNGSLSGVL